VVVLTETELEVYRGGRSSTSPVSCWCNLWCPAIEQLLLHQMHQIWTGYP